MAKRILVPRATPGELRFIHEDSLTAGLSQLGATKVRRASQVEQLADLSAAAQAWVRSTYPDAPSLAWWADLAISNGPVLGPFNLRQEALDAEVHWLEQHGIPVAG